MPKLADRLEVLTSSKSSPPPSNRPVAETGELRLRSAFQGVAQFFFFSRKWCALFWASAEYDNDDMCR